MVPCLETRSEVQSPMSRSFAGRALAALLALLMTAQFGCYNTYNVTLDELGKAAEGGRDAAVTINTEGGEEVVVTENSRIGVTDSDGIYHPVSPFNFTITPGQLVAPDEDLLLARSEISSGNVKVISGTKTTLLVSAAVIAVLGVGLTVALTAPDRKQFGE